MRQFFRAILVLGLVAFSSSAWASQFCAGFEEGYKTVKGNMVIVPICPIPPITPIGSTKNSRTSSLNELPVSRIHNTPDICFRRLLGNTAVQVQMAERRSSHRVIPLLRVRPSLATHIVARLYGGRVYWRYIH